MLSFLECFQLEIMFYWIGKIFHKNFNKKQRLKNKDESWVDNGLNLINSIYNIKAIIISSVLYEKRFNNIINFNSIIRWNKRKIFK